MTSRGGEKLGRFEIAGKDRAWRWAEAEVIDKNTVRVVNDEIAYPVAVRYAWASNPEGANLVNSEGLPASVFRTDDWGDVIASESPQQKLQAERRELAKEIQRLRTKQTTLARGTEAFKANAKKRQQLMEKFRTLGK